MLPASDLLALSYAPALGGDERHRLDARAHASLRRLSGAEPSRADVGEGLVLVVGAPPVPAVGGGGGGVVSLSQGPRTVDGRLLDASAIAARLGRGDVGDLAPPFAACLLPDGPGTLVGATDAVGLRHLYWLQGTGWAALATSSLALARLAGAAFDEEAIGTFALVGSHLGERTPFAGVRLLPPGATVRLAAGQARVSEPPPPAPPRERLDHRAAVDAGVEVVRALASACLRAYPDPLLELSGGLDSRMLLAGIAPQARAGLRAATVGPSGSGDHRIAGSLAQRYRLAHTQVTLDALGALPPEQVADLAEAAALARDCGGSPPALTVLDWQERQLDQGPRLSGQNGEFARGFYYAGQRAHPRVRDDLVDTLARWRIFTNEAADPDLFAAGFVEDMRATAIRAVRRAFAAYDADWLSATDEFYLRERMRRWVGIAYSAACTRRVVQAPFFHPAYLDWARSCPPAGKRGSKVFGAVLAALDPDLATVPLDSGRTPRALASTSPLERLAGARATLRKVVRKVDQRVRGRTRPASGAAIVAAGVQQAWSRRPGALDSVMDLAFLDPRAVEEAAGARRHLRPASVGLLVNLDVAQRRLR